MTSANFRATCSADGRPEAPGAKSIGLLPSRLGNALAQLMPGRQAGCTAMLSLLLASCAYRQDAAGSSGMQGGETAAPDAMEEAQPSAGRELASSQVAARHSGDAPQRRFVKTDVSNAPSRRDTAALPEAWVSGTEENLLAFPAPDVSMAIESDGDTSSSAPAPAAMLLDIDQESASHWVQLTPWYALPVVLALGMPLLGIMGRRGPRRAATGRRAPLVPHEPDSGPMSAGIAADDDVMVIPMGVGAMDRRPWSCTPDPLAREDWSIGLTVRYTPQDGMRPVFATKNNCEVHVDERIDTTGRHGNGHATMLAKAPQLSRGDSALRPQGDSPSASSTAAGSATIFAGPFVCQPSILEEDVPTVVPLEVSKTPESTLSTAGDLSASPLERVAALLANVTPEGEVFLDVQHGLPVVEFAGEASLPANVLAELESMLLETRDPDGAQVTWLLTQVLALRMAHVDLREADALHQAATTLALHGSERATEEMRGCWRARLIELDLARAARQSGASRMLALRNMTTRHAAALEAGDSTVLKAWIRVLLHWAQQQLGDSALARLTGAAALAERLRGMPGMADEGQLLLADVMLRRSRLEHGGVRARTLAEAQRLLDELFARTSTGRAALAVAEAALERGRHLQSRVAGEAFSHALVHAFLAGSDTRWHAASLRLRLSIQLAYESLPGISVQGNVALDLVHKLDRLPAPPGEAIEGMARTLVRHGEYGRACRLCAEAWHAGTQAPTLLETWRQASVQWALNLTSPSNRSDWQENERQRRVATQMQ